MSAERITIAAAAPTAFIQGAAAGVQIKDIVFLGTPTQSDVRWTSATALGWKFVRPRWTGGTKLSASSAFTVTADLGLQEMWQWDIKVVDRDGNGVSSVPVKLTDVLGNVVVNTTTNSEGRVSFGSGITSNAICVLDHYISSGSYLTRTRSPFTAKINTRDLTGYNGNYLEREYAFDWIGEATGNYEDVGDIVAIQDQAGTPTPWTEEELP